MWQENPQGLWIVLLMLLSMRCLGSAFADIIFSSFLRHLNSEKEHCKRQGRKRQVDKVLIIFFSGDIHFSKVNSLLTISLQYQLYR